MKGEIVKLKNKILCIFFAVSMIFILSSCISSKTTGPKKPVVYTSFYPIAELTKEIAGDTVEVRTFMPENKDPHLWEPSPRNMRKLLKSDMLIVNGANMENWLPQIKDVAPDLKIVTLSDSVDLITYKGAAAIGDFQYMAQQKSKQGETYKFDFGHTHEDVMRVSFINNNDKKSKDELIKIGKNNMKSKGQLVPQDSTIDVEENKVYALEMGHESGQIFYKFPKSGNWVLVSDRISEDLLPYNLTDKDGELLEIEKILEGSTSGLDKITYDPHSWMSIVNAKKYLNVIMNELSDKYPQYSDKYRENKIKIVSALSELQFEYKEKFDKLDFKHFVVTHNAYAYLARDFGLKQYPLQGLVSTETPSLKTIKKAIDFCEFYGVKTIFYEFNGQQKGADTVASEIGGKSKPLASMEYNFSLKESGLDSYKKIIKMNLDNLYESMKEVK
ncbi:zinc ABC transporter substrate-binding protein [Helcococcus ovis]|nr:zinc ABC transporter substrate-binding protein [Helcococcus ovis]